MFTVATQQTWAAAFVVFVVSNGLKKNQLELKTRLMLGFLCGWW